MWKYLPEARRHEYAESEEEARRWLDAGVENKQTEARRPPELSTRDNVSRAIYTEVKEGRGTPHGGAFLDISYMPAERVKRKLPSMYHQFLELADVDITQQPMEVGPTTHYVMGGIRVDPDTAAATVPGLFAAGEAAAGLHGANRLGGNSLSDLVVFGRRAGEAAALYARELKSAPRIPEAEVEDEARDLVAPFERAGGENPYEVHHALQQCMNDLVGIYRSEKDLERALEQLARLEARAARVGIEGTRVYNPGWHLCRDLRNMIVVSEAVTRSALLRKESRGAHSRLDYPNLDPALGRVNLCCVRSGETMKVHPTPLPEMPAELKRLFEPAPQPAGAKA
jgi:succinate dehydrogenase / fumarate reductase flavoprotein subunit